MERIEIAYEFANEINSKYISKIILFGSVARREDAEESDIDILIIASSKEKVEDYISDIVYNYLAKYHELVSAHIISEEHYNRTKDYTFLTNVLKEGVILV